MSVPWQRCWSGPWTLAASGDERAISLVALGRALGAQLAGRPAEAVRAVDSVFPGSLPADWRRRRS